MRLVATKGICGQMQASSVALLRRYWRLVVALEVLLVAGILTLFGNDGYGRWVITIYSVIIAAVLLTGMIRDLSKGRYGVDILAVIAIVSTLWVGEYWATIIIVIMMLGGEALEEYAQARAKAELSALLAKVPKRAHKQMVDGSLHDVSIDTIMRGDLIVVKPGEVIPIDGVVVQGSSSLDESSITGESEPVDIGPKGEVLSGAVNGASPLTIRTLRIAKDSQFAQIVSLVQAAGDTRAPFVRMADRYAVPFTGIALVIAAAAWWMSGDPRRFAEVLVVATPCPLLIAAPVAMISGMSRAAKHGIIVKSGGVLERLATVRAAAFDKTGTLTNGELALDEVLPVKGVDGKMLLQIAASIERSSGHVTALSIQRESSRRHIAPLPVGRLTEIAGGGLRGYIDKKLTIAGKREFLMKHGVAAMDIPAHDHTATYVAQDGKYLGCITFRDMVRPNSKQTLEALRDLGVGRFIMLTGDHEKTAQRIARRLGITDIRADCLPKDKRDIVRQFPIRPIMMVGDGVNDAPVLASSDVGVAMGARGSTAASESADVVIMLDDISRVASAVRIAQRTVHVARQSVLLGIAISIALMLIAMFGVIPAVVGALLQELVDVAVIVNALRAHSGGRAKTV